VFAFGTSVLPFCLAVGVAVFVFVSGVFTPDGSVLIASSGFSGFGFEATDVVANPRAGLAAGFFFLPAMLIFSIFNLVMSIGCVGIEYCTVKSSELKLVTLIAHYDTKFRVACFTLGQDVSLSPRIFNIAARTAVPHFLRPYIQSFTMAEETTANGDIQALDLGALRKVLLSNSTKHRTSELNQLNDKLVSQGR
jgi:hypothetical protein